MSLSNEQKDKLIYGKPELEESLLARVGSGGIKTKRPKGDSSRAVKRARTQTVSTSGVAFKPSRGKVFYPAHSGFVRDEANDECMVTDWARKMHDQWLTTPGSPRFSAWLQLINITSGFELIDESFVQTLENLGITCSPLSKFGDETMDGLIPPEGGITSMPASTSLEKIQVLGALTLVALGKQFTRDFWTNYIRNRLTSIAGITGRQGYLDEAWFAHDALSETHAFLQAYDLIRVNIFEWLEEEVNDPNKSGFVHQTLIMVYRLLKGSGLTHLNMIIQHIMIKAPYVFSFSKLSSEVAKYNQLCDAIDALNVTSGYEKIAVRNHEFPDITARDMPMLTLIATELASMEQESISRYNRTKIGEKAKQMCMDIVEKVRILEDKRNEISVEATNRKILGDDDELLRTLFQKDNQAPEVDRTRAAPPDAGQRGGSLPTRPDLPIIDPLNPQPGPSTA